MNRIHNGKERKDTEQRTGFNLAPLVDGYGTIASYRIKKAARAFAEEHVSNGLRVIPLEQGERLQIAGLPDLGMIYLGISEGKSVFQRRPGEKIERLLLKASTGFRYDIFVGQYWTSDFIRHSFPGADTNFDSVSNVQALELVVYDKKEGNLEHSWLSLGLNKEKILGPGSNPIEMKVKVRTAVLPAVPKATRKTMRLDTIKPPEQNMAFTLTPSEATKLVQETARKNLSLHPIGNIEPVLNNRQWISVHEREIEFWKHGGVVSLRFVRDGHPMAEDVELGKMTLKGSELTRGYRVMFNAYPLENNAKIGAHDYVLLATVVKPSNELYSCFVFGARG